MTSLVLGSSPKVEAGLKARWAGTLLKAERELCVAAPPRPPEAEEATLRLCPVRMSVSRSVVKREAEEATLRQ